MPDRKGLARIGIRAAGGLVGVAVAVVAIGGATLLPLPDFAIGAPSQTVTPVPADQQRVCPGPLLQLAADAGAATRPSSVGAPTTTTGSTGAEVRTHTLKADTDSESADEAPLLATVSTPPGASAAPLIAGAQLQNAAAQDLAGLAAASCAEPSADTWLAAGSTALGQTSLVLLANPSAVDATVDLAIFSESGPVSAPGATGIVVPAGAQKVVPLAGLAPSAAAPVVHVTTSGGEVVASLQQSYEQGIQPRGAEMAGATGAPGRQQIIPGVTIASMNAVKGAQSAEGVGVDFPVVRILVPGDKDAQVTVGAVGETGTAAGNSYATTVKAGTVAEVPLNDLKDGSYTVTVNSSVPVVASARTSVIGSKTRDFAWFSSAQPLLKQALTSVPGGYTPTLHVANPGEADRTVTVQSVAAGSKAFTLTVPAEGGAGANLKPGTYVVTGADGLTASISYAADGRTSSFALAPPGPLAAPITVYPN
ncbi:DUF5719 family protein [Leifsonia shinshuensis]|uniref:DUF5719 family protein n=1 Tax=Leifsonia shinshuensis TaxID=150026 RepID=UPI002856DA9C|nr:DUF5719 family protein [Leifsonia shinshuensis]MDR6973277.1 hypothetical protein [Leifsonia shinshuensis]